jgi:hypothetical protein
MEYEIIKFSNIANSHRYFVTIDNKFPINFCFRDIDFTIIPSRGTFNGVIYPNVSRQVFYSIFREIFYTYLGYKFECKNPNNDLHQYEIITYTNDTSKINPNLFLTSTNVYYKSTSEIPNYQISIKKIQIPSNAEIKSKLDYFKFSFYLKTLHKVDNFAHWTDIILNIMVNFRDLILIHKIDNINNFNLLEIQDYINCELFEKFLKKCKTDHHQPHLH